jgi:hypothetical protein
LESLDLEYPKVDAQELAKYAGYIEELKNE